MQTESVDDSFAVAPFTYDADIGLDPERLEDSPALVDAMCRAGFRLTLPPGTFMKDGGTQVDLMVPAAAGGSGRRGARLGVHGLEGTLVSHTRRKISSLVSDEDRSCILKVAGPAALLVAKVHKIGERLEEPAGHRQEQLPKDTFDIYRLLSAIDTAELAEEFGLLRSHKILSRVTSEALSKFRSLGSRSGMGTTLLVNSVRDLEDPDFIIESSVALSQDLLQAIAQ